jgi:hypothetical protein
MRGDYVLIEKYSFLSFKWIHYFKLCTEQYACSHILQQKLEKNNADPHRITGLLDFFHCAVFQKIETTAIQKLDLFPSSGEGWKTPTQLGSLERANLNHWATLSDLHVCLIT